ncbi:iron chelate uptake ABC transporter family permease subunit [Janibacter sp. CX7]|jgi:iron complex transport system permease protein|uniref:FecCD family ABC transporter permease n=1 Tax=Janibacter sp. CX7 TaxID=2963431 RepID=UPI0020CCD383|nr:iron chelate uptake ABC transporter family permease subunit [Janibacter sp. CX7]UTT65106.1 iron chelate uptake ABC transporter family permease subunit [Janibacter sp. CX7]
MSTLAPARRRASALGLVLVGLVVATALATLTMGGLGVALADLPAGIVEVARGEATGKANFVLGHLRGPRLLVALGAGAALGASGALFQSVTRNPLGSPDVIGVSAGAGAGAAFVGLLLPGATSIVLGSVAGAALAVGLVAVSTGTGLSNPMRMVLAGIGVSAMAYAFTQYVVYVVARDKATVLSAYLNGSLNARGWDHVVTIWLVLAVAAVPLALLSVPLGLTEMGDEVAASLGVHSGAVRRRAVLLSVLLAGGAVAVAGPIAFVALTAPHVTRRLARSARPLLGLSAVTGALLLSAADLATQQVPLFDGLPVGILTLAIGGVYLGALLVSEWKKAT